MRKTRAFKLATEQHIADLFRITQHILKDAGYEHYEISNYARIDNSEKTWRSRHNRKYWSFAPYTGLGPAAHSYTAPVRYWNVRDVGLYAAALAQGRLPIQERENTTTEQQITEAIYLGLRTAGGINMTHFEKSFQFIFNQQYKDTLKALCQENLVIMEKGRCALTPEGMLFHDSIVERLLLSHDE
jgi:oxygen-independent coproporphyrinogen-3 oxidase